MDGCGVAGLADLGVQPDIGDESVGVVEAGEVADRGHDSRTERLRTGAGGVPSDDPRPRLGFADDDVLTPGDGPDRGKLAALAQELGVADRVRLLGPVPQTELRTYYGAADLLVLASSREGWANVLLESMACGTPVVATSICGTPEVVTAPEAGRLIPERTPECLAEAVKLLRADTPDRAATRRYAERFSWDQTTQGQIDLFRTILMGHT